MGTPSSSRRALLAGLWSIVAALTLTSFVVAVAFAYASKNYDDADEENSNSNDQNDWNEQGGSNIAVTSRAMVFAAIWTAVLSGILVAYGTVVLGVTMPTGKYYTCCAGSVYRLTPSSIGTFGGSLLMFANLTLVCAILFGEFEIRDFNFGAGGQGEEQNEGKEYREYRNNRVDQSSFAFSVMCIFLTVLYSAFAVLVFRSSHLLLEESVASLSQSPSGNPEINNAPGYIGGDRFGVSPYGKGANV